LRFRRVLQVLLGQVLLVAFAGVNAWLPHYTFILIIGYIVMMMVFIGWQSRKMISKQKEAKMELSKARRIIRIKPSEVTQVMNKDPLLPKDLKSQFSILLYMFLPFIIIFALFAPLRELILGDAEPGSFRTFIGFLVLYEAFFIISMSSRFASAIMIKRKGFSMLSVPNEYIITEKGILSPNLAVKFPVKVKRIDYNLERGFVEFDMIGSTSVSGGVTRVRLYTRKPKELYEILKDKVEIVKS